MKVMGKKLPKNTLTCPCCGRDRAVDAVECDGCGARQVGSVLFFQGWRLDPILQFGVFLLVGAYVSELIAGLIVEFSAWKKRG